MFTADRRTGHGTIAMFQRERKMTTAGPCAECQAAWRKYQQDYRARRKANGGQPLGRPAGWRITRPGCVRSLGWPY
jgi:hypothetical protein